MALLREYIISRMNYLLDQMKYPCQIVVKGLPTSDEIEGYIVQLARGEMSFDDVLSLTSD